MKNLILPLFLFCTLLVGCSAKEKTYTLSGTTQATPKGATLYLLDGNNLTKVDSTVVEEGRFEFTRSFIKSELFRLKLQRDYPIFLDFIAEEGLIEVILDPLLQSAKGTPLNDEKTRLDAELSLINQEVQVYLDSIKKNNPDIKQQESAVKNYIITNQVKERQSKILMAFLDNNLNNVLSVYSVVNLKDMISDELLEEVINRLKPEFKEHNSIQAIFNRINIMKSTDEGKVFIDSNIEAEGDKVSLSD